MKLDKIIGIGQRATVYKDDIYALKVFDKDYSKKNIFYEAFVNVMIEEAGLPIPKTYVVVDIDNQLAIKMDYVDGKPVSQCISNDFNKTKEYIGKMVDLQIQISKSYVQVPISFKDRLRNNIQRTDKLEETKKNNLIKLLAMLPNGNSLCHGDFHSNNVLVSNDNLWVIDWIDASYGPVETDVCRSFMIYLLYAPELAEIYLSTYCNKTSIKKEDILVWLPIVAAARLSENIEGECEKLKGWLGLKN